MVLDPWDESLQRYAQLGYSREEVCMALAANGDGKDEQVGCGLGPVEGVCTTTILHVKYYRLALLSWECREGLLLF